jgi:hypothetical protein
MSKIHIHIHEGHQGSRGLKRHAERSIAESHKGQGMLGTGEPKAREHDSDKAHQKAMHEYASFRDPAGRNALIKHMGPAKAKQFHAKTVAAHGPRQPEGAQHERDSDAEDAVTGRSGQYHNTNTRRAFANTRKMELSAHKEAKLTRGTGLEHPGEAPARGTSPKGREERAAHHHELKKYQGTTKHLEKSEARAARAERTNVPGQRNYKREFGKVVKDEDDATPRVGKTRGAMAQQRGHVMQQMTGARVKNVTAASGSTEFAKNTTLKGHKASMGRAFHTANTAK